MVSRFGSQYQRPERITYTCIRFRNQNLRVASVSRTLTTSERSTPRRISFPLALVHEVKIERAGIRKAAIKIPDTRKLNLLNESFGARCQDPRVDGLEAAMFDFKTNREILAPRNALYCVWVRAHEGPTAPLICLWIDPAMTMFESREVALEPDAAGAQSETQVKFAQEGAS
jgi:hypothetical protein